MTDPVVSPPPLRVFISYSHKDEKMRVKLGEHLAPLVHDGLIRIWHDREIEAGADWAGEIDREISEADVILLLVSAPFLNSQYCRRELLQALEQRSTGKSLPIPIILRHCDWTTVFNRGDYKTQALPRDDRPVAGGRWPNQDAAFAVIAKELRAQIQRLLEKTFAENHSVIPITYRSPALIFKPFHRRDLTECIYETGITVTNSSDRRLNHCSVRIIDIEPSKPDSIFWILSNSKLKHPSPKDEPFGLNPGDPKEIPLAQFDTINGTMDNLGIELLCSSTQKYESLDPEQTYILTITGSAEIGIPIQHRYRLLRDDIGRLHLDEVAED